MKKPVLIVTSMVTVTASALAFFSPGSGPGGPDKVDQTLKNVSKAGFMSPAQAEAIMHARVAAAGKANEANSTMAADPSKQPAMKQGAQRASAPGTPSAQSPATPGAGTTPAAPPKEERREPRWRLEGVMVGGKEKPSAIFIVEGWGEAVLHEGEKLNENTKVVGIGNKGVILFSVKEKKAQILTPW